MKIVWNKRPSKILRRFARKLCEKYPLQNNVVVTSLTQPVGEVFYGEYLNNGKLHVISLEKDQKGRILLDTFAHEYKHAINEETSKNGHSECGVQLWARNRLKEFYGED